MYVFLEYNLFVYFKFLFSRTQVFMYFYHFWALCELFSLLQSLTVCSPCVSIYKNHFYVLFAVSYVCIVYTQCVSMNTGLHKQVMMDYLCGLKAGQTNSTSKSHNGTNVNILIYILACISVK